MDCPHHPKKVQRSCRSMRKGTALLPVLIIISMVTIIVVMFFGISTVQMRSSSNHAAVHAVTALQDMAVNAAIGQLRMGTTEDNALWISQPGAIRTYRADGGAASPAPAY
jgi:type II secretory pathway component PulK